MPQNAYQRLQESTKLPDRQKNLAEAELDGLLAMIEVEDSAHSAGPLLDSIEAFRVSILKELAPLFSELAEKYAAKNIAMHLDASAFLNGGRELALEFVLGPYRHRLVGTVTSDVLAFQEIRYSPGVDGELDSGPMLRLRLLTPEKFRDFLCARLTLLIKTATRR